MANTPRGSIHPPSHTGQPGEDQTYAAFERADRLRRRRDSIRSLIIVFVVMPAIIALVCWLVMK